MMMLKGHSKNNLVDFVFQVCIRLCNLNQMVFNNNQVAHVPDTLDKYLAHFQGFCFTLFFKLYRSQLQISSGNNNQT